MTLVKAHRPHPRHDSAMIRIAFTVLFVTSLLLPSTAGSATISHDGVWQAETHDGQLVISDLRHQTPAHHRRLETRTHHIAPGAVLMVQNDPFGFVLALDAAPELWFIALAPDAGPFHQGFVHSYVAGMEESLVSEQGRFARLRIDLSQPLVALSPAPLRFAVNGWRADGSCVTIHLIARHEIGPCSKATSYD